MSGGFTRRIKCEYWSTGSSVSPRPVIENCSCRERQLKLEKARATQQQQEEFRRQQAEWRRMEQEKTEAENRRISEFLKCRQQMEHSRGEKIREQSEAKQHMLRKVAVTLPHSFLSVCERRPDDSILCSDVCSSPRR